MTQRTPGVIRNFLKKQQPSFDKRFGLPKDALPTNPFKLSAEWKVLKQQFDKKELDYFIKKYNKFVLQFNNDVTASEETQISQLIKFEILMNRVLRAMKNCKGDIIRLSRSIKSFNEKHDGADLEPNEMDYITKLEDRLAGAKASQGAKVSEYTKLQQEHNSLMKSLKATRDQRFERAESATKDFMGLIRALEDKQFRDTEGRQLELIKKAVAMEEKKLGTPMVFPDGQLDLAINCASNISKAEEIDE